MELKNGFNFLANRAKKNGDFGFTYKNIISIIIIYNIDNIDITQLKFLLSTLSAGPFFMPIPRFAGSRHPFHPIFHSVQIPLPLETY
jgi:hypothetical protein